MRILLPLILLLLLPVSLSAGVFKIAEGWQPSFVPWTNANTSRGIEGEVVAYRTVPVSLYAYMTSTPPHAEMGGEFIITYQGGKGSLWAFFTDLQQFQDLASLNDCYFGSRMGLPVIHYRFVATRSAGNSFNNNVKFWNYCTSAYDTWYDHSWSYSVAVTTLNGGIDASQTTITLTTNPALKFEFGVVVKIDNEFIRLGNQSGNVFTNSVRAVDGSTAAAHSNGATVAYAYFDCVNRPVCDGWLGAFEELDACRNARIPSLGYFNFKYQIDGGAWTALTSAEGGGNHWTPGTFCPTSGDDYSPWSLLWYEQYTSWIIGQPASGMSSPARLVTTQFASAGATSIVVGAFHGPISSGSVISFISGKTATTTSSTAAGTTTLPVSALAQSISVGDSAPMPSGKVGLGGQSSTYGRADISQGNLLTNPGFESASGGWNNLTNRSTDFAHTGTFSLKSFNGNYIVQSFTTAAGDKVAISGWAKVTATQSGEGLLLLVKSTDLSQTYFQSTKVSSVVDWTFVTGYFISGGGTYSLVVEAPGANTTGYWDDAIVEIVK